MKSNVASTKMDPELAKHAPNPNVDSGSEFSDAVVRACSEFVARSNMSAREIASSLSRNLVYRIAGKARELITPEAVLQIHGMMDDDLSTNMRCAVSIRDELSQFIFTELVAMSAVPLPARGKKRSFHVRDRAIFEARQKGLSYGKIAARQKMTRHAVQAAYRREISRRRSIVPEQEKLRAHFRAIGIHIKDPAP